MDDPLIRFPGYALRRAANATAAELSARLATSISSEASDCLRSSAWRSTARARACA